MPDDPTAEPAIEINTRPDHHGAGVNHPVEVKQKRGPVRTVLRLIKLTLFVVLPLALLLALLAPTLLSTDAGTRWLVGQINGRIDGIVAIEELSLSWFGGQKITGLTYTDTVRGIDLTVGEVDAPDVGLFSTLTGSRRFGEVHLTDVDLIYIQPQRERLAEAGEKPTITEQDQPLALPQSLSGTLVVDDLRVEYEAADLEPVVLLLPQGRLEMPDLRDIAFDFDATLRQGERNGRIRIAGELLNLFDPDGVVQPMQARYSLDTTVQGMPTRVLDRFLSGLLSDRSGQGFWGEPGRIAAVLGEGELNAEAKAEGMIRELAAQLTVQTPNLSVELYQERDGNTLIASSDSSARLALTPDAFAALVPGGGLTLEEATILELGTLEMRLPFDDNAFLWDDAALAIGLGTVDEQSFAIRTPRDELIWVDGLRLIGGGASVAKELAFDLSAELSTVDQDGEVMRDALSANLLIRRPMAYDRELDFFTGELPLAFADALAGMDGQLVTWLGESLSMQVLIQGSVVTDSEGDRVLQRSFALIPDGRINGEVTGLIEGGRLTFATGTTRPLQAQLVPEAFASLMAMVTRRPDEPVLTISEPMDVLIWLREGERDLSIATSPGRPGMGRFYPDPDRTNLGIEIELSPARVYDPAMNATYQLQGGKITFSAPDLRGKAKVDAQLELWVPQYQGADGVIALMTWETTATQILDSEGSVPLSPAAILDQVALDGDLSLDRVPSGLLDTLLDREGGMVAVIGPIVEQMQADFTYENGQPTGASVRLNWDEQNNQPMPGATASMRPIQFDIDGDKMLTVRGGQDIEIEVRVTPAFGDRWMGQLHPFLLDAQSGDRPVQITIDGESFRFPLGDKTMAGSVVNAEVDLGSIEFGPRAMIDDVLEFVGEPVERAVFDPARVSLIDGNISYEGLGMSVRNVSLRLDGELDLNSGQIVDMAVRVPGASLIHVFQDLEGVIPPDDYLNIPMSGPIRSPAFDSQRIPREVARLLLQNQVNQQQDRVRQEIEQAIPDEVRDVLPNLFPRPGQNPGAGDAGTNNGNAGQDAGEAPSAEEVLVDHALELFFGQRQRQQPEENQ